MIGGHRRHPLWLVFLIHRVSGLLLALFLPAHFWLLARSLRGEAALDSALAWTAHPLVKIAEFGLVFLLAVHFFGGLRLLAFEFLPWSGPQKTLAAAVVALAAMTSGLFLLRVV